MNAVTVILLTERKKVNDGNCDDDGDDSELTSKLNMELGQAQKIYEIEKSKHI